MTTPVQAQFFPGNGNELPGSSGILINPEGVIELRQVTPTGKASSRKQIEQLAQKHLPPEVLVPTPERVLSIKNLSSEILRHFAEQKPLPPEILYLAGLQRIDSIVFDREAGDVYLVGPADAFGPDASGRVIGVGSGRPVLQLDDLITVLRADNRDRNGSIGCSIDPTTQNMSNLQEFLRRNSTPASPAQVQMRFQQMSKILGPQEISVWGVPPNSRFAAALVEADLRMKRISLGMEPAGVPGIRSHLSLLQPQGNSLQRWWFVPMYEPLETNAEGTVFTLKGPRAKLLAQEEFTDAGGRRSNSNFTRQSTQKFAQLFSEHFEELAEKSPPFAELQNCYDIAVTVALIRQMAARHELQSVFATLIEHPQLAPKTYAVPRSVPSSSTYRVSGPGMLIGLVGGVTIDMEPVLKSAQPKQTEAVKSFRERIPQDRVFGNVGEGKSK